MRRTKALATSAFLFSAAASFALVTGEREAQACGGCFSPPETPTVVTDHRMILSVSKDESTLYDQIKYTGSPSAFAWILPVNGGVDDIGIGVSADIVFSAIDRSTQTQILPPPRNCPPRPDNCANAKNSASPQASDGAGSSGSSGGVTVLKTEVVGPYETKLIAATTAAALRTWLTDNKFNIPADVQPVIDGYVGFSNFLAVRLVPGQGVQDMRPIRVTTKGPTVSLPLRMVAAGTGPNVGISLWVVAEGRYEPQNFQSFIVRADDVSWDWTASKSNYVEVRAQKTADGGGKVWEIESSIKLSRQQIESTIQNGTFNGGGPVPTTDEEIAQQDYLPEKDGQGNITKTAKEVRTEDLAALFHGIPTSAEPRITRMRGDLVHDALNADLNMTASSDQAELSNVRQLTKELNQPQCPVYSGCDNVGTAPRDEAIARSSGGGGETFSCGTGVTTKRLPGGNKAWFALGFAGLGLAEIVRRRIRQQKRATRS